MNKYTHRTKVTKETISDSLHLDEYGDVHELQFIEKYYKNGYLYGFYADGVLLGDLVEVDEDYVNFEYWWKIDKTKVEEVN